MNALILAPDSLQEGIFTIPRGEGRWTLNVVELLAKAGYEVDIVNLSTMGLPQGEYKDKQPEGINWLIKTLDDCVNENRKYDVFFSHFPIHIENKPIWNKVQQIVKKALFGTWWPNSVYEWPTKWKTPFIPGTTIVTPFRGNGFVKTIPLGHVDKLGPSAFHKKIIIWTCKRPMTNDRGN